MSGRLGICRICSSKAAKYACSGCLLPFCSVACSTAHKNAGCANTVSRTAFTSVKEFTDERLKRDYFFLEDANNCLEATQRKNKKPRVNRARKPTKLQMECEKREISYLMSPAGLLRSQYFATFLKKNECISWPIRFVALAVPNFSHYVKRVSEKRTIAHVFEELLKSANPVSKFFLAFQEVPINSLHFLLKAERVPASEAQFFDIDASKPISEVLKYHLIVDYIDIMVVRAEEYDAKNIREPLRERRVP